MTALHSQVGGDHYRKHGPLQPWAILREYVSPEELRGFHKCTALVYLLRERDKNGDEDIRKAAHVLQHLVELLPPLPASEERSGGTVPPDSEARPVHNPERLTDPGDGYRFAYADEKRSDCSHWWCRKDRVWEVMVDPNDRMLSPGFTYRVKL